MATGDSSLVNLGFTDHAGEPQRVGKNKSLDILLLDKFGTERQMVGRGMFGVIDFWMSHSSPLHR